MGDDFAQNRFEARRAHAPADSMETEAPSTFDISQYWALLVKRRLVILCSLIAAVIIGAAVTLVMTPIYVASTTLQIDREAARVLNVDEVAPRESMVQGEEFFQTQYGLLRSRTLAERVIETLGLASSDAFLGQMKAEVPSAEDRDRASLIQRRREAVLKVVQDNMSVSPVRGSRLVAINFESPDPALSARIANTFAEGYIQSNLERKFESSAYAREFLEERIAQTKARLEDSERSLVAYAAAQQIINVTEANETTGDAQPLVTHNLTAINNALAAATANRVAAEERWRRASAAPIETLGQVLNSPTAQRLTEERAKLDAEYQQKLGVFQPEWPEMQQLRARISELDRQIATIARDIRASVQNEYAIALNQERSLQRQVNELKGDVLDMRARSVQYNILQREVDTSRTLYDGLLQRYKEVGIAGNITANNISIVDPATPPNKPAKPRILFNLLLAAVLGAGIGITAAFLLEALDETMATPEDAERKLNLPVLGVAPLVPAGQTPIDALGDLRSPFSEAYYSLRTALQFSTPDGAPKVLVVTSSRPGEGKSTTAYAIALNLARIGKRVLLADGDLRNPSLHRILGFENNEGMSNLLSGSAAIGGVVRKTTHEHLDFIPCGPLPPNPAELWGGDRLRQLLVEALERYDHVIVDGPPVLGFADAPLLAAAADGTLFVIESRGTRRGQARGAIRRLLMGHSRIIGTIMTKFNAKSVNYGGYEYAYDYDYGAREAGRRGKKGRR